MTHRIQAAFAAVVLLSGCAALQPRPVIENRFAKLAYDHKPHPDPDPRTGEKASITLAVQSGETEVSRRVIKLTDLGDRAQAAMVEATGGNPKLIVASTSSGGGSIEDRRSQSRVLNVATVPTTFATPGDRIDAMRISLWVDPAKSKGWKIVGWDVAATRDDVIKVGDLTDGSSSKFSASTGLGLGPTFPSAQVGYEASRETNREMEVVDKSTLDAAVDADGTAWLFQTGGWREDLARSREIVVQIAYEPDAAKPEPAEYHYYTFSDLFITTGADQGKPQAADKVMLNQRRVFAPGNTLPVCGLAKVVYRQRKITDERDRATFSEADDHVELVTKETADVPFLLAPSVETRFYWIGVGDGSLAFRPKGSNRAVDLQFDTYDDARAFIDWMQAVRLAKTGIGNGDIGIDDPRNDSLTAISAQQLFSLAPHRGPKHDDPTYCLTKKAG